MFRRTKAVVRIYKVMIKQLLRNIQLWQYRREYLKMERAILGNVIQYHHPELSEKQSLKLAKNAHFMLNPSYINQRKETE